MGGEEPCAQDGHRNASQGPQLRVPAAEQLRHCASLPWSSRDTCTSLSLSFQGNKINIYTLKTGWQLTEEVGTRVHNGKRVVSAVQRHGPVLGTQLSLLSLQTPLVVPLVDERGTMASIAYLMGGREALITRVEELFAKLHSIY